MKKLVILTSVILGMGIFSGCSSNPATKESSSSTPATSETATKDSSKSTDSEVKEVKTIFTGVMQAEGSSEETDHQRIFLKEVAAVEDPEKIVNSFTNDGVVLLVTKEKVPADLKAGDKVQVTLTGLPIMTMSIPPQLPGQAISEVTIVK